MASTSLTLDILRADVAEELYLDPGEISDDDNLLQAGLDSVRLLSLVDRWRRLGAHADFADLAERPTISAWWNLLRGTDA
ncbi:phosphopantetheine-binding protein [Streptomyces xiamenensis]|jgi:bifunctional isochorismate lyase/aryl carrier protein|uniref:phosphopantetheine-binding protein n=1 Tax=Streptomyces TaxID=1883 RepID=UPI0004C4BAB3|nr:MULTISPECIES: phosphopantetheine-binding protein [Streptomyces]MCU4746380.1 phosphopantetheine-binding protein [Streptomyces sp. G-5]QKV69010.1 isochorismatase [Streptomyces harbinensis]QQN76666.1 isochorismatase [Streptomyces sp. XC 2026]